jgi:hypothetical protein
MPDTPTMDEVRALARELIQRIPDRFWEEPHLGAMALGLAFGCVCLNADIDQAQIHRLVDDTLALLRTEEDQPERGEPS